MFAICVIKLVKKLQFIKRKKGKMYCLCAAATYVGMVMKFAKVFASSETFYPLSLYNYLKSIKIFLNCYKV